MAHSSDTRKGRTIKPYAAYGQKEKIFGFPSLPFSMSDNFFLTGWFVDNQLISLFF
jgi:hypothetical protein